MSSKADVSDFVGFEPVCRFDNEFSTLMVFPAEEGELDVVQVGIDEKSITTRLSKSQARSCTNSCTRSSGNHRD